MKRFLMVGLAILLPIGLALYAAHAMDLVGMIVRGHGGVGGHP